MSLILTHLIFNIITLMVGTVIVPILPRTQSFKNWLKLSDGVRIPAQALWLQGCAFSTALYCLAPSREGWFQLAS